MMEWFDSHCHVDEEAFDEDRAETLARMAEHGVTRYAVIGSDMETSRRSIRFASAHSGAVAVGGDEAVLSIRPGDRVTLLPDMSKAITFG